ncbi:MAG: glutamate-1-semialdehyde 2,1-aminomutase [Sedimentisphaerales bacterium]|nr:glutamate-1-semialdehyde 2,1-aminomutase [Sedimentisphaerales bacterium]
MSDLPQDNAELHQIARKVMPGGVNSPVRAFGAVGGTPRFIARAQGVRVWDVEGREYIDYVGSWGPCILGHAHPQVVEAIQAAAARGSTFGAPTAAEIALARRIIELMPNLEMVRLVSSGTEATMTAVRLARAATGRDRIIKFAGCYHGHADSFLVKAGSGAATGGHPTSPGIPRSTVNTTLVAQFNDIASVTQLLGMFPGSVAAVIIEPIVGNSGVILPSSGFLQDLRRLCDKAGTLLIFDEVMTGFRVAPGGAQQLYNVRPDLTTLGKIIGGGLPVGAVGGPKALMEQLAPAGPVYQAGTLSGNPIATAAGLATLNLLNDEAYAKLEACGAQLEAGVRENLSKLSLPYQFVRVGSMACLFFADRPVHDFADVQRCDQQAFARYFHGMLEQGIYLPPSQFEAFFLSTAHTEADIERTIQINYDALQKQRMQ